MSPSAAAGLGDADDQFHSGIYDTTKLMEAWDIEFARTSQLAFYIGRAKQYSGYPDEALEWYDEALKHSPVFAWAYYERSEIHEKSSEKRKLALDLLTFLKVVVAEKLESQLNAEHKKAILRKGHLVFSIDAPLSREIYALARQVDAFDYLSLLRIIEGMLDVNLISQADELASLLRDRFQPDAFGLLALSRLSQAKGNAIEAIEAIEKAVDMLPRHVWLRGQACARLIELGDHVKAKRAIDFFASDPQLDIEDVSHRLPALRFRLATRQGDLLAALAILQDIDLDWSCIESWVYAEAIYLFARYHKAWTPEEITFLQLLRDYLFQFFESSENACLAVLHYHFAQSDWKEAHNLMLKIADRPIYESREVVARRFEVACHLQDLPEAQLIYTTRWQKNPALNVSELALSMRMLSELKDWQSAADVAADIVERGMSLDESYGILLIVRRAGQHQRFVDLVERTGRTDSFAMTLEEMLIDDLCILHGQLKLPVPGRPRGLSRSNAILVKALDEHRRGSGRLAGFICSDRAYFVSVLTLIASLASNIDRDAHWYVFLSEDVPESWVEQLQEFCSRLKFDVTTVLESAFFSRNEGFTTDYGLFSGGRSLARSAYFRIYAADWLLKKNIYSRAVYMDTDIVCQTDLNTLFTMDLGAFPLAARPEELGPPVIDASLKCGVMPENYINSGVLVFNFNHEKLADYLHDAIWQSENAGARLTFHDQCALNIAFAGAILHLPNEFNTFLRPFKTYEDELRSGVLLHYLDRPKPWDSGAKYDHRLPWLMAATVVKAVVPAGWYREVMAAGIGQAVTPQPSPQASS